VTGTRTITVSPSHTVSWYINGTLDKTTTVINGAQPSYGGTPARTQNGVTLTFAGWATEQNSKIYAAESSLPVVTADVSYYAVFTLSTYFYFVLPGQSTTSTSAKDYMYAGKGTCIVPDGISGRWYDSSHDLSAYIVTAPTDETIRKGLATYYNGEGSKASYDKGWTYSIAWKTLSFNGTAVGYDYSVIDSGTTLHMDSAITLDTTTEATFMYNVTQPDGTTVSQSTLHKKNISVPVNSTVDISKYTFSTDGYSYQSKKTSNGVTYTFDGWYTDQAFTTLADDSVTVTGSKTFYAHYIATAYTLTYVVNGGIFSDGTTANKTSRQQAEDTVVLIPNPHRDGYTFTGWSGSNGKTYGPSTTRLTMPASNLTLTAQWEENVTIHYEATTGGSVSPASETLALVTGTALGSTAAAATGYHFVKWTNASGTEVSTDAAFVPAKVNGLNVAATYTAYFAEDAAVRINYVSNGGGSVSRGSESLAPATGVAAGSTATAAAGYHFVNWTSDEAGTTQLSADAAYVPTKATTEAWIDGTTYYANFAEDAAVRINYVSNGHGSVSRGSENLAPATGVAAGSTATAAAGYHFVNWTSDEAGTTQLSADAAYVPTKATTEAWIDGTTYYANFAEDANVTIHYVTTVGGSVSLESESLAPATGNAAGSTAMASTGYKFENWTKENTIVSTDAAFVPAKVNNLNVAATYTAHFAEDRTVTQPTNYTVNYYLDNVLSKADSYTKVSTAWINDKNPQIAIQGTIDVSADKFTGYSLASDVSNIPATGTSVNSGTIYNIYYTINSFKVTYSYTGTVPANASKLPETRKYNYNELVTVASASTAEGYTFVGWDIDGVDTQGNKKSVLSALAAFFGLTASTDTFRMPNNDVNITGYFTANTDTAYTVEHYLQNLSDDGYTIDAGATEKKQGTTGELTSAEAKTTYTGFTAQTFAQKTIAADGSTVVQIYYNRNSYTVTYVMNGGNIGGNTANQIFANQKYGATTPAVANPTRTGYTFTGWSPVVAGTVTATVTYVAQWTRNGGGSGGSDSGSSDSGSGSSTTTITPNQTPLNSGVTEETPDAIVPDGVLIKEEPLPLGAMPKTGEEGSRKYMLAALLGLFLLFFKKKRGNEEMQ